MSKYIYKFFIYQTTSKKYFSILWQPPQIQAQFQFALVVGKLFVVSLQRKVRVFVQKSRCPNKHFLICARSMRVVCA